jgi:hypothetical protein
MLQGSQWTGLVGVLAFVGLAEGACIHLVLDGRYPLVDGLHVLLVVYGLLWLIGDFHALRLMPTHITGTHLHVQVGLRWSAAVPLADIAQVTRTTDTPGELKALDLTLAGASTVLVVLARPARVDGLFGLHRHTCRLLLCADDPDALVRALS